MGFFSWTIDNGNQTDDNVTLANSYSGHANAGRNVLFLTPSHVINCAPYEGYGAFVPLKPDNTIDNRWLNSRGEIDYYQVLAHLNLPSSRLQGMDDDDVRYLGIELESDEIHTPVKLSFNMQARYESCRAPGNCPSQGFFYD